MFTVVPNAFGGYAISCDYCGTCWEKVDATREQAQAIVTEMSHFPDDYWHNDDHPQYKFLHMVERLIWNQGETYDKAVRIVKLFPAVPFGKEFKFGD